MKIIVTKEILKLYDKYDCDFGLLDERWASKKDRDKVSIDQTYTLGRYVELLKSLKVKCLSDTLRIKTLSELGELEGSIDDEVVQILKKRIL